MNEAKVVTNDVPLTRDELRAALIGKTHKGDTKLITLFGVEIELHQPTLSKILEAREEDDEKTRTANIFITYAFVPGTNERIFEDTDRSTILEWPFNKDLIAVQEAIVELTGIDLGKATEELKGDPLGDSS